MKEPKCNFAWKVFFGITISSLIFSTPALADSASKHKQFTEDFMDCTFSNTGANPYFSLNVGTQILLEGEEKGELVQVQIDVTNMTELVDGVLTRVVFEQEWVDGELVEESWNWFARCVETNDIFYFGEDVNIYEDGEISHEGSWRAGEDDAIPGIIMPGTFLLGARYYQEIAPDVALDRAENIEMGLTVETPAGTFYNCVGVLETTPLEPSAKDIKIYAPGDGLIVDDILERVSAFSAP